MYTGNFTGVTWPSLITKQTNKKSFRSIEQT